MQADEASDANVGAQSLSYHSQNTAIITESTREFKSHATSPPLPVVNYLTGDSPRSRYPWCMHHEDHRP